MRQTHRASQVPARGYLAATYLLYTLFAPDGINPPGVIAEHGCWSNTLYPANQPSLLPHRCPSGYLSSKVG